MAVPLNETSALCMNCGLCCNGAIFANAPVRPDEAVFAEGAGFDIIDISEGKAFRLPCKHLCGGACTIYDQPRPSICGDYFCRLARRLTDGDVDFAEAKGHVKAALAIIEQIRPLLHEGEDLAQARDRWAKQNLVPVTASEAPFAVLMAALHLQIDRYFRYDSQILLRSPQSGR